MTCLFLDESILVDKLEENKYPNWKLYFDGVVNVHGNRFGVVLISPSDSTVEVRSILWLNTLYHSMQAALNLKIQRSTIIWDLYLLVNGRSQILI